MLKKTTIHYLIGLGLALLTIPVIEAVIFVLPDIGWHFLTVTYITIFIFQILFYYLTTNYKFGLTVLSFIINFILWTFEQVFLEKNFNDTFIYQNDNYKIGVLILGGLLWVTNKLLLDKLFELNKSIVKQTSRINV